MCRFRNRVGWLGGHGAKLIAATGDRRHTYIALVGGSQVRRRVLLSLQGIRQYFLPFNNVEFQCISVYISFTRMKSLVSPRPSLVIANDAWSITRVLQV